MKESGFYGMLSRIKYIRRWGLMRSANPENLAEHSLDVAVIAHLLAVIGNRRLGRSYPVGAVVLAALYHDSPEILTGDLPTPVKYGSTQLRGAYGELEEAAAHRLIEMLPEDLQEDFCPCFFLRDPDLARLIKAADKISALQKCVEEERAGNTEFRRAKAATQKALEGLHLPEAEIFLNEFFPACGKNLDELSEL